MKKSIITLLVLLALTWITAPFFAQQTKSSPATTPSASPNEPRTFNLTKPNTNHRLLAELVGTWNYKLKIRMGPDRWTETSGIVVRQPIMNGRYFLADFDVEMLPGADGKLEKANFKGKAIEGYDNVKQKFVSIWIDNASTGITTFEGTYDAASRTFTYNAETEAEPGKITKVRELISVADSNHYSLTWLETHGGHEIKTVEINYTRKT